MKTINTLFTFAIGLLILTNCSSEEPEIANGGQMAQDDMCLYVTIDELQEDDGTNTRSYLSRDLKTHLWITDDEMRVYDNDLHRYDIYKFGYNDNSNNIGIFRRTNPKSNINNLASWALYPKESVHSGHWDLDEDSEQSFTTAWILVCADKDGNLQPLEYTQYTAQQTLFADRLPRWGQVTQVNGGEGLNTNLSFLTGVLRLQLVGTAGKADHLKVQMLKAGKPFNIAGRFRTTLAINDEKQAKLYKQGIMTIEEVTQSYNSWRGSMIHKNARKTIFYMDKLFKKLFVKE